jgi:hypothetical protein
VAVSMLASGGMTGVMAAASWQGLAPSRPPGALGIGAATSCVLLLIGWRLLALSNAARWLVTITYAMWFVFLTVGADSSPSDPSPAQLVDVLTACVCLWALWNAKASAVFTKQYRERVVPFTTASRRLDAIQVLILATIPWSVWKIVSAGLEASAEGAAAGG